MLIDKHITINISYRNITHYLKLGYNAVLHNDLEIKTSDLPIASHQKINVLCELCGKENNLRYHKYIENKNRHGFYGCKKCSRQKAILTSRDLYGVDNYTQLEESKIKVAENNIKKYGVKTTLLEKNTQEKRAKTMMEKYGTDKFWEITEPNLLPKFIPKKIESKDNDIKNPSLRYKNIYDSNYRKYRNEVRRLTKKSLDVLFVNWNGTDYYDGEYIKDNFSLKNTDSCFPTIDHKISVYYGYKNNIDPEIISKVDNLCITKLRINSLKRDTIEKDFKLPS